METGRLESSESHERAAGDCVNTKLNADLVSAVGIRHDQEFNVV